MKRKITGILLIIFLLCPKPLLALVDSRDTATFMNGFRRVALSAFQLPFRAVQRTLSGPIGLGTAQGVVEGTVQTVTDMVGGVFDMAAAAAPYAKYAAFAL